MTIKLVRSKTVEECTTEELEQELQRRYKAELLDALRRSLPFVQKAYQEGGYKGWENSANLQEHISELIEKNS